MRWPNVAGIIVESRLSSSRAFPGGGPFVVTVRYAYELDGRPLQGNRIRYGHDSFDNTYLEAAAQRELKRYPVGGPVAVRCNPANPNEAVLEIGIKAHTYLHLLVSGGFFAAGVEGLLNALTR